MTPTAPTGFPPPEDSWFSRTTVKPHIQVKIPAVPPNITAAQLRRPNTSRPVVAGTSARRLPSPTGAQELSPRTRRSPLDAAVRQKCDTPAIERRAWRTATHPWMTAAHPAITAAHPSLVAAHPWTSAAHPYAIAACGSALRQRGSAAGVSAEIASTPAISILNPQLTSS
jgi:hypothetical protein